MSTRGQGALGWRRGPMRRVVEPLGLRWVRSAVSFARLGASSGDAAKLLGRVGVIALASKLGVWRDRPVGVRVRYGKRRFRCVIGRRADVEVLRETFVEREYDLRPGARPRVILDLGSHIGLSILAFHAQFPDARIVGVEPDPVSSRYLHANIAQLPGVKVEQVAVSDEEGVQPFVRRREGWNSSLGSTSLLGTNGIAGQRLRVGVTTLDSLMRRLQLRYIDLLKIDIEGAEHRVLRSFKNLDRVSGIVGEFHGDLTGESAEEFFALLADFDVHADERWPGRYVFHATRTA